MSRGAHVEHQLVALAELAGTINRSLTQNKEQRPRMQNKDTANIQLPTEPTEKMRIPHETGIISHLIITIAGNQTMIPTNQAMSILILALLTLTSGYCRYVVIG